MDNTIDKLLTTVEVARRLRVDQSSVNNWVRAGKLKSFRTPGGHNRIAERELQVFIGGGGLEVSSQGESDLADSGYGECGPGDAGTLAGASREGALANPRLVSPSAARRLLVVDDDPYELARFRRQLAPLIGDTLDLRCADNGIEALVQVGAFRPQVVVLDYVMPGLDGIEVCTRLRRMPEMEDIEVVVMSSAMTPSIRDRALAAGAVEAWAKPRPIEDFIALLGIHQEALTK